MDNLSLLGKKWVLPQDNSGGDFLARLRKIRGIDESEIHAGEQMCDLTKAAERISAAIKNGEKILVVGDYDADGITASAILFKTIQNFGGTVSVRLPHRLHDGYGLNPKFITEAKELGVKLIVTVDNGISAYSEVELANSLGIDVIVTDHHTPPEILPKAFAIVNPKRKNCAYPDKNLSGAAVALKVAEGVRNANLRSPFPEDLRNELYALAAIGTLADVCPLTGENRALVATGLEALPKIKNVGLRKILANAGVHGKISAEDIGFRVAPRINAAGRIADPLVAFQALTNGGGEQFADELEKLNRERQDWTTKVLTEIEERLGEFGTEKILIASGDFHAGIIGLAAGNLAEKYFRPAIVMAVRDGKLVGSCRSPLAEFDITAALSANSDLLEKFGGHRGAAGFTLLEKNRAEFEKQISEFAEKNIAQIELIPTLELDLEIGEKDLTEKFLSELNSLAPFGSGNPEPNLLWRNAPLAEIRAIGGDAKHLKLNVGAGKLAAIGFGFGEFAEKLGKQKHADLVFNFGENAWNGSRELQLKIIDAR